MLAQLAAFALSLGATRADTSLVPDLPLVEARVAGPSRTLIVLLSADGNWAGFVKGLTRTFNAAGVSVIGLKARAYLTDAPKKTPEIAARDLERILAAYVPAWKADTIVVVGYSRGANLAPFMLSRLPRPWLGRISFLALLSPQQFAGFEFHFSDLFTETRRPQDLPILPEVERLRGLPMLCVYGSDDAGALCPAAPAKLMDVVARSQGHRLEDPEEVGALVLQAFHHR